MKPVASLLLAVLLLLSLTACGQEAPQAPATLGQALLQDFQTRIKDSPQADLETLAQGRFQDYDAMFLELPAPVRRRGLHLQPKGTYLRAYSRGSLEAPLAARYREILDYAAVQGWTLTGCAYETCLNELVVDSPEEDILQIDIPVLSGNKVDRQPPTPPAVFPTCHGAS